MKNLAIKSEPIKMHQTSGLIFDGHKSVESIPQVFAMDNSDGLICKLEDKTGVQNITEVFVMKKCNSDLEGQEELINSSVSSLYHSRVTPAKVKKSESTEKLTSYELRLCPLKQFTIKKD
jgi:hypothetical protein